MKRAALLKTLLLIPLALLMIYLTWYLHTEGLVDKREVSREPLIEVDNFTLIRYNDNGEQNYTLSGDHMTHYDDERGSIINAPFLTAYQPLSNKPTEHYQSWTATSDTAYINAANTTIDLEHNILLTRYNETEMIDSTLETASLLIENRGEKISNQLPVILRSTQTTITGVGLVAYPNKGQYSILNDIKTTYEKNHAKDRQ